MKDSDEDKLETSGKKLVLRGDGSGRLIGIFSQGDNDISDYDISEWVSKSDTWGKYLNMERKSMKS